MNSLTILGKYLDQPKLVENFSKAVPAILVVGGGVYAANNVLKSSKEDRSKELTRNLLVMTTTIVSAIFAPKIAAKVVKEHHQHAEIPLKELIKNFKEKNKLSDDIVQILNKAEEKQIKFKEVKKLFTEIGKDEAGKEFLSGENGLIPDPENIDSKHIFGEIGKLSVMGLIPVLGGITGGIAGDALTDKNWKDKIPNKIKEGTYQYLANIFLCNIGAGAALAVLEKFNIKSKSARAVGMISGIILAGIVFGSAVANLVSEKIIDPLVGIKHKQKGLYIERRPEVLDVSLHVDDVATVAVLSGLKWIEPALPVLYAVSGYRAGIGYRNGKENT